jgi:hypothetical protein
MIMAFNENAAPDNVEKIGSNSDKWKAKAFINIFLPTENGGRRKLGSLKLQGNSTSEAELIEYLREDPSRVTAVMAGAEIDFQMAEAKAGTGFKLG